MVNFFQDSAYEDWQVMKTFRDTDVTKDGEDRKKPQFDRYRHTLLCSELKHLYTGVTRTRHVLLFIEQDDRQAQHAFQLWKDMDLVTFGLLEPVSQEAIEHLISRAGESK